MQFADAHARRTEIPWLLWSVYRVVLVEHIGDRLDLLWSGEHQTMPTVDTENGVCVGRIVHLPSLDLAVRGASCSRDSAAYEPSQ